MGANSSSQSQGGAASSVPFSFEQLHITESVVFEDFEPRVIFSNYEFTRRSEDRLGEGTFGCVYRGAHRMTQDYVAIKVIDKKKMMQINCMHLLQKETEFMKSIQHPNIVSFLERYESRDHWYIVIEYCNGGDMANFMRVKGKLSETEIRCFISQMKQGMGALKENNIIHRDLKPGNIVLSYDAAGESHKDITKYDVSDIIFKITDFGLARYLREGEVALTRCGTPVYMAPEVLLNQVYDDKVDLFAIGVIIFQALTGRLPYETPQWIDLIHVYRENKSVIEFPGNISSDLVNMISGLLKVDPDDRMTMSDFLGSGIIDCPANKFVNEFRKTMKSFTHHLDESVVQEDLETIIKEQREVVYSNLLPLIDAELDSMNLNLKEKRKIKIIVRKEIREFTNNMIAHRDKIMGEYRSWIDEMLASYSLEMNQQMEKNLFASPSKLRIGHEEISANLKKQFADRIADDEMNSLLGKHFSELQKQQRDKITHVLANIDAQRQRAFLTYSGQIRKYMMMKASKTRMDAVHKETVVRVMNDFMGNENFLRYAHRAEVQVIYQRLEKDLQEFYDNIWKDVDSAKQGLEIEKKEDIILMIDSLVREYKVRMEDFCSSNMDVLNSSSLTLDDQHVSITNDLKTRFQSLLSRQKPHDQQAMEQMLENKLLEAFEQVNQKMEERITHQLQLVDRTFAQYRKLLNDYAKSSDISQHDMRSIHKSLTETQVTELRKLLPAKADSGYYEDRLTVLMDDEFSRRELKKKGDEAVDEMGSSLTGNYITEAHIFYEFLMRFNLSDCEKGMTSEDDIEYRHDLAEADSIKCLTFLMKNTGIDALSSAKMQLKIRNSDSLDKFMTEYQKKPVTAVRMSVRLKTSWQSRSMRKRDNFLLAMPIDELQQKMKQLHDCRLAGGVRQEVDVSGERVREMDQEIMEDMVSELRSKSVPDATIECVRRFITRIDHRP